MCTTPDISTSVTGSQVLTWEKQALESPVGRGQPRRATRPPREHLCQCQGEGDGPISPPTHLLRKEEYPLIFFFPETKAASFTPHLLEDLRHPWQPQHRAGTNWEQKIPTTSYSSRSGRSTWTTEQELSHVSLARTEAQTPFS